MTKFDSNVARPSADVSSDISPEQQDQQSLQDAKLSFNREEVSRTTQTSDVFEALLDETRSLAESIQQEYQERLEEMMQFASTLLNNTPQGEFLESFGIGADRVAEYMAERSLDATSENFASAVDYLLGFVVEGRFGEQFSEALAELGLDADGISQLAAQEVLATARAEFPEPSSDTDLRDSLEWGGAEVFKMLKTLGLKDEEDSPILAA